MLSISHAVTGAVIATKIGNPLLAIPLIIMSHYLEDSISHWDAGTGMGSGKKTRQNALKDGVVDIFIAGVLVLIYYPNSLTSPSTFITSPAVWGAFLGLLPDFLEAPRNFWKYEPVWLRPINRFHQSFHHSIPRVIDGLVPQFILLTTLWFLR